MREVFVEDWVVFLDAEREREREGVEPDLDCRPRLLLLDLDLVAERPRLLLLERCLFWNERREKLHDKSPCLKQPSFSSSLKKLISEQTVLTNGCLMYFKYSYECMWHHV